jgi:hypothetical protein
MTAFMTAAPTILEHTGRQTRGHTDADHEFPELTLMWAG